MRSQLLKICVSCAALMALVVAIPAPLLAGRPAGVPEIDGSSVSAGLGILAAGVLIVRSWRRSK